MLERPANDPPASNLTAFQRTDSASQLTERRSFCCSELSIKISERSQIGSFKAVEQWCRKANSVCLLNDKKMGGTDHQIHTSVIQSEGHVIFEIQDVDVLPQTAPTL